MSKQFLPPVESNGVIEEAKSSGKLKAIAELKFEADTYRM
jgi:hypothetical protein